MIDPEKDGIEHINVYSQGKSRLGLLLSNFAKTAFKYNEIWFQSVEGSWYSYKLCQKQKEYKDSIEYINDVYSLCKLSGYKAKSEGKRLLEKYNATDVSEIPKNILKNIYKQKLKYNPEIFDLLMNNELPLLHYYVYGNKVVNADKYFWTVQLWNEIKQEIKDGTLV